MLPPHVIVSYNHADSADVLPFIMDLESYGIEVWWDGIGMEFGSDWRHKFEGVVKTNEEVYCLNVVGRSGIGNSQKEEHRFLQGQANKSPLHLINVLLPGGSSEVFDGIGDAGKHYADLREENPNAWHVLESLLHRILGERFVFSEEALAILHLVERKPKSFYLAIRHDPTDSEWENVLQQLKAEGFSILQDEDPRPDALSRSVRELIRSASLVLLDARTDIASQNLAPDVAYALGLARAYHKPIVLIVSPEDKVLDRESISAVIECNDLAEIADLVLSGVKSTYESLQYPYLTAPTDEVLALKFTDVHVCPYVRLHVFRLESRYQKRWQELEFISRSLSLLKGIANLAKEEELPILNEGSSQRIAKQFCSMFESELQAAFNAVNDLVTDTPRQLADAQRSINGIRARVGKHRHDTIDAAKKFLELFYQRIKRLRLAHDDGLNDQEAMQRDGNWVRGPGWWQRHADLQLEHVQEARGFLELFFHNLQSLLTPITEEFGKDERAPV